MDDLNADDQHRTVNAHNESDGENTPSYSGFTYDEKRKCLISKNGEERRLRAQSLSVFNELAKTPDQIVSKQHLTEKIWPTVLVTDDSIGKCISDIRKALSDKDHVVLKTIPRQGYMLVSDASGADVGSATIARNSQRAAWAVLVILLFGLLFYWTGSRDDETQASAVAASAIPGTPRATLAVGSNTNVTTKESMAAAVLPELRVALSRYKTLELTDSSNPDYNIVITDTAENRISVELQDQTSSVVYAQTYDNSAEPQSSEITAQRIAASIASPGVGALDRELLHASRLKPIESLTHAECFAHGFGCSKCSGEEDNITKRAEACLAHVLENDPDNARALALQATIYAHQYWWGNTLAEPLRSHLKLRKHLPEKAIAAANAAESLSVGDDSSIYWGMTEAYYSSCQTDKMATSIKRGLEINPADPNLLAAFGNWLSYSGRWDEGAAMTQRALEIEPQHYRKWWWMGLAKTHYFKEEYQAAYDDFLKSFNERNWISHLQFAYTLPHLGRMEEAQHAVKRLQQLAPQITVERALEHYEILCFPDSFLENMKNGLMLAGLPSRGNSESFSDIVLPRAKIMELDNYRAEYLDHGQGEPVVFVHGTLSDYRSWGFYLVPISENHRFITYSRRYFGTQDWVDDGENFKSQTHVQDLIDFIEALDAGPIHVVSWSTGVITAMHAAIQRPDLFKSAIHYEPVDMAIFNDQDVDEKQLHEWGQRWLPYEEAMNANDVELAVQRFVETVFQTAEGGYNLEREALQEVFRQNARTVAVEQAEPDETRFTLSCDKVGQNTTPTIIVVGSETHYFYSKQARLFADCSGSELLSIPGVNHRGPIDAVLPITDIITSFVETNR